MMFSGTSLATAAAVWSLLSPSLAHYVQDAQSNVALYWGQGDNQQPLADFCYESAVDIIPIAFLNTFNAQSNGWGGDNFGNGCWGGYAYYNAPGYDGKNVPANDRLHSWCPSLQEGVPICQQQGKKVILSLGGSWDATSMYPAYDLVGAADGTAFAEFLWGAYGPYSDAWVAQGGARPLDRGYNNDTLSIKTDIDGFDFDIELPNSDSAVGYIECINHLRFLMNRDNPTKKYLITGAPQCPLPEVNMGDMIQGVAFDILWVQFYNNPACSNTAPGFNFETWTQASTLGLSKDAKIYIGMLGSPTAGSPTDYLTPAAACTLINKVKGFPSFGGAMIWEATTALNNIVDAHNTTYYEAIKNCLPPAPVVSTTTTSSSTSQTSTTTSTSHSTTSTSSCTTSTSSTSTSSTSTSTSPTSTSTSSSSTSTSSTSTSTSSTSTSATSTSTSSTSTSTSTSSTSTSTSSTLTSSTSTSATSTSTSTSTSSTSTSTSSTLTSSTSTSATSTSATSTSATSTSATSTGTSSTSTSTSATSISTSSTSTSASSSQTSSSSSSSSSSITSSTLTSSSSIHPSVTPPFGNSTTTSSTSSHPVGPGGSSTHPIPTSSAAGGVTSKPTSASTTKYTTSTAYTTIVKTVTSCAATVTDCPAGPHLTTVIVPLYTTVCPVTETSPPAAPTSSPAGPVVTPYTTSTVYTTKVYTVTACPPSVTNCPVGQVTTDIISLYTTVCPVAAATTPVSVSLPSSLPSGEQETTTSTSHSTATSYITVKVIKSTATVIPTPKYPTPIKVVAGTGTPVPSGFTSASKPTNAPGGESTAAATSTPISPVVPVTGAGSRVGGPMGAVLAVVGAFALLM